jgi:hypothetical protein
MRDTLAAAPRSGNLGVRDKHEQTAHMDLAPTSPILLDLLEEWETERLVVRPPRSGDGDEVLNAILVSLSELRRWPASMAWAVHEQTVDSVERWCRVSRANFILRTDLQFLLWMNDQPGLVVGCVALTNLNWESRSFELGYWGNSSCARRGLVTEGARAIVEWGFQNLAARRIYALPDEHNERSWKLVERLGFLLEGVLKNERTDPDGTPCNAKLYAITRSPGRGV